MRAMVMAAGVGTRLKPLTDQLPKPMVPIGNRPTMEHLVRHLARYGFNEQIANLWYLPQSIRGYFEDGTDFGVSMEYSPEQELQGTAGGVRGARAFLAGDTFLVTSGDGLTDIDLEAFLEFHKKKKALASIALYPVEDPSHFGVALRDSQDRIVGFQEKPAPHQAKSKLVNTGIYLFEPEIFSLIPKCGPYDFGRELFPRLVQLDAPFFGYRMQGYWSDIGSIPAYRQSCLDFVQGKINLPLNAERLDLELFVQGKVQIHPEAKIHGPVLLGDGVRIEAGSELVGPISLGPGTRIGKGARLVRSVLWEDVKVGEGACCQEAILASGVELERGAQVTGAILAHGTKLGSSCTVREDLLEEGATCNFCG